jgi:hypothetical protein
MRESRAAFLKDGKESGKKIRKKGKKPLAFLGKPCYN